MKLALHFSLFRFLVVCITGFFISSWKVPMRIIESNSLLAGLLKTKTVIQVLLELWQAWCQWLLPSMIESEEPFPNASSEFPPMQLHCISFCPITVDQREEISTFLSTVPWWESCKLSWGHPLAFSLLIQTGHGLPAQVSGSPRVCH